MLTHVGVPSSVILILLELPLLLQLYHDGLAGCGRHASLSKHVTQYTAAAAAYFILQPIQYISLYFLMAIQYTVIQYFTIFKAQWRLSSPSRRTIFPTEFANSSHLRQLIFTYWVSEVALGHSRLIYWRHFLIFWAVSHAFQFLVPKWTQTILFLLKMCQDAWLITL